MLTTFATVVRRPAPAFRSILAPLLAALVLTLAGPGGALGAAATSSTFHFSTMQQWGTPLGPTTRASNCPSSVLSDYVWINATGNGVSHQTVNGAGDFWATSTFTGEASLTMYPVSSLAGIGTDAQGNTVATIVGPSDGVVTGHFTEWFGISANNQNGVIHGTIHFEGTDAAGTAVKVNAVFHAAWLPGADPSGPPSFYFDTATC